MFRGENDCFSIERGTHIHIDVEREREREREIETVVRGPVVYNRLQARDVMLRPDD